MNEHKISPFYTLPLNKLRQKERDSEGEQERGSEDDQGAQNLHPYGNEIYMEDCWGLIVTNR